MLLILDNCEHLIAACSSLAQQLLAAAPGLNILATSRESLAVSGELIYQIQGLSLPSFDSATALDPRNLKQYDAIRLFVERGRAISPHFKITPENASTIIEICQRLNGIPLALELASARLNILTPQQIAARLDDRFALLSSGQRTADVTHHQTLRAAIDWSYDLLTPEEQILLRRLAVFDAGCTLDMAEGVCTGNGVTVSSTLDLLSSLVNKSLVMAETSGRAEARYRLLDTIREYAFEKLREAGEVAHFRDRYLEFFVARSEEIAPKLQGSSYQGLWLNWFVGELDNLRSALDWSLESGQVTAGLRLAGALWLFWDMHSHQSEGLARLEKFLSRTSDRTLARANALFAAGLFEYRRGEYRSSRAYLQESLSIGHELGDKRVRALALDRLSSVAYTQGKYAEALLFADESLALYQELDDRRGIAETLNAKGELARLQGDYEVAGKFYEESLALSRELGDRFGISKSLHNLAYVVQHQGDYQRAAMLFKEDLITSQEVGDKVSTALAVAGLAGIAGLTKEPKRAARLFGAVQTALATLGIILDAIDRSDLDRDIQMVKSQLEPAVFATLWEEGCGMSLEQTIEYALSSLIPLATPTPKPHEEVGGLTEREREVVTLVAQGKRNNEIAEQLVLSKRTVEKHVANILSKLELTSRAQIVRWAMEHNLTSTST